MVWQIKLQEQFRDIANQEISLPPVVVSPRNSIDDMEK